MTTVRPPEPSGPVRRPSSVRGTAAATPPPAAPRRPAQPGGKRAPKKRPPADDSVLTDHQPAVVVAVKRVFATQGANYFLLLGTTVFLVGFGLVMVLSSSSVESYRQNDSNSYAAFGRQGVYALLGLPVMLVASRVPARIWKKLAWPALGVAMAVQLLVFTPMGFGYGGNRNWVDFGLFSAQPSEVVKLALILWIALILSTKQRLLGDWKHVLLPIGPIAGLAIGFVLIGNDLGTAVIMLTIVYGALFFAGVKLRYLISSGALLGLMGLVLAFASSSRSERINAWLVGCTPEQYERFCWQPTHGTWALSAGGVFGVGLGNSKAKWSWLPEADNDYIFAIIGEELGLIGAVVVLVLFVVLAWAFIRVIRSSTDLFSRLVTTGVMFWIIGQALVNIAVVLGVLPVLGVPLPLISAGGSALIATLLAIGVVLSFARQQSPHNNEEHFVEQTPADRSRLAAYGRSTTPGAR